MATAGERFLDTFTTTCAIVLLFIAFEMRRNTPIGRLFSKLLGV